MPTELFTGTDDSGNSEVVLNIEWSPYPGETTINGATFSWGGTNRLIAALLRARDETHGTPAESARISQVQIAQQVSGVDHARKLWSKRSGHF